MADWLTWDVDPDTGIEQFEYNANNDIRVEFLRSHNFGSARSTNPVEGQIEADETGALWIFYSSSWRPLGISADGVIVSDLDFSLFEALNLVLENLGSDLSPSAGSVGRLAFRNGRVVFVKTASVAGKLAEVLPTSEDAVDLYVDPAGETFSAVSPKRRIAFRVPAGWGGGSIFLRLSVQLDAAETAGDDIDFSLDWNALLVGSEGTDKTPQVATGTTDIGADNGQFTVHEVEIEIPANSSPDVLFAGALMWLDLYRTNVGGAGKVGSVTLLSMRAAYVAANYDR